MDDERELMFADLIDQWDRRAKSLDKSAQSASSEFEDAEAHRFKLQAGTIRRMISELNWKLSQIDAQGD